MSPTIKRLVCAAVVFLCGVAATVWADEAPTHRPAFSLEEIVETRAPGQFVLSPDGSTAVFNYASRYFGHPLFPDFGNDASKDLPRVLTRWKFHRVRIRR